MSIWKVTSVRPEEMLVAGKITSKQFEFGTIAGSVGKKIDIQKKPGINEDGGLIAINQKYILTLTIDGHFGRDTTEILLTYLENQLVSEKIIPADFSTPEQIFQIFHEFSLEVVDQLAQQNAKGEASFDFTLLDINNRILYYYSVGDLMIFVHDEHRGWGHDYQISNRHFYEWINARKLMGYHFGSIQLSAGNRILAVTDGIIDEPVIDTKQITHLFQRKEFNATNFVQFALENNDEDDNITCICITVP